MGLSLLWSLPPRKFLSTHWILNQHHELVPCDTVPQWAFYRSSKTTMKILYTTQYWSSIIDFLGLNFQVKSSSGFEIPATRSHYTSPHFRRTVREPDHDVYTYRCHSIIFHLSNYFFIPNQFIFVYFLKSRLDTIEVRRPSDLAPIQSAWVKQHWQGKASADEMKESSGKG